MFVVKLLVLSRNALQDGRQVGRNVFINWVVEDGDVMCFKVLKSKHAQLTEKKY